VEDFFELGADRLQAAAIAAPFDALIIGGGTSGIVAAVTLAGRGMRVALVDAGPLATLTHVVSTDLRFITDGASRLRRSLEFNGVNAITNAPYGPFVSCLGGRGLFWNGASPRMQADDFASWPLTYADLDESYVWAEQQFRVSTDYPGGRLQRQIETQLRASGIESQRCPFAIDTHPTRDGWIGGTIGNAMSILLRSNQFGTPTARIRAAIRVRATALLFDTARKNCRGVLLESPNGAFELIAPRVILACGAFQSTRLAAVSNAPDRSGTMGRFVGDHHFVRSNFELDPDFYDPAHREIAIAWSPSTPTRPHQLELHAPGALLFNDGGDGVWAPAKSRDYAVMIRSFGAVEPSADSVLTAAPSNTLNGFTVSAPYSEADLAHREWMRQTVETAGAALGGRTLDIEVMPAGRSFHEFGGLRMSADPNLGVTTPTGAFHACGGLYAADAALFPSIAAANPHLTIAALARRNALAIA
jgi:choline dehydrogenase-like flavoprotein